MEDKQRKAEVSLGHQKPQYSLPFLAHRTVNSNADMVGASISPQSLPHGSFCIASSQDPPLLCLPFFFWLFQFSLLQFLPSMAWTMNVFTPPSTRPSCPPPLRDSLLILNEAPPTSHLISVCAPVCAVRSWSYRLCHIKKTASHRIPFHPPAFRIFPDPLALMVPESWKGDSDVQGEMQMWDADVLCRARHSTAIPSQHVTSYKSLY